MRILTIITRGDSIGGAQTHVLSISKLLQKDGHEVMVLVGGEEGPFTELLKAEGISHCFSKYLKRAISPLKDLLAVYELGRLIKSYKPDIITLHSSKASIIGRLCKVYTDIPVVITVHGWAFTTGVNKTEALVYRFIEKLLGNVANKIIVVSEYDRALALRNSIVPESKLITIHNGIPVNKAEPSLKTIEKSTIDLVMIARFDSQKDHYTLLRACKDISGITLHLLGDGPGYESVRLFANDLGISDKVKFWGYTKDVNQALEIADIFLLISNWEGFPISTLEAMNYGLPVVVSDVGGAAEAIVVNETGFLIPRGSVAVLREKLLTLLADKDLRVRMGKNSRERLKENFSDEIMYRKTYGVYEEILKE
jgi:glycosyltransferase involved in cell wall biosynthesis